MKDRLKGKIIMVAGAGAIGGALARRYAEEGASVLLGDLDEGLAKQTADDIVTHGGVARGIKLDGADDTSVAAAFAQAEGEFGGLDGVHVNFATFADGAAGEDIMGLPIETYDQVMQVNARGFVLCARHAIPMLQKRGGGAINFTSSGAAHQGEPVRFAYAMSKAAVNALMRHVASRYGPDGIRANVIAPGIVAHSGIADVLVGDLAEHFRKGNPLGLFGAPEDIAAMGAMLLSDDARYISGQVISVDGGATMRS